MIDYETEEQQVAAFKNWWKENATSLIFGVVVGVSGLLGWRYYIDQNQNHLVQASDLYMQVVQSVMLNVVDDKVNDINNTLINEYSNTPYAALSSLALAKSEYEKGNVDAAAEQLASAAENATDEVTKHIANLRLASVYLEQKKYDEVSSLLNMAHDEAFDAHYEELKGDMHMAKGDVDQARAAYDKAITLLGSSAGKWLKLKRKNLGSVQTSASADLNSVTA